MKDIHEVLRRKQAKYAQLSKQIEALQQAAEKLREVAPLPAESDEEETAVLADVEEQGSSMAARAGSSPAGAAASAPKPAPRAPRWP
jgi:DNA-binding protein H-NS